MNTRSSTRFLLQLTSIVAFVALTNARGQEKAEESLNDTARFLAGMNPFTSPTALALTRSAEWSRYAAFMDTHWTGFDQGWMKPVRKWSESELRGVDQRAAVFYPF